MAGVAAGTEVAFSLEGDRIVMTPMEPTWRVLISVAATPQLPLRSPPTDRLSVGT